LWLSAAFESLELGNRHHGQGVLCNAFGLSTGCGLVPHLRPWILEIIAMIIMGMLVVLAQIALMPAGCQWPAALKLPG